MTMAIAWFEPYCCWTDSAFASVETADQVGEKGLFFIGIVKIATTDFPKAELGSVILNQPADYRVMSATVSRVSLKCTCFEHASLMSYNTVDGKH